MTANVGPRSGLVEFRALAPTLGHDEGTAVGEAAAGGQVQQIGRLTFDLVKPLVGAIRIRHRLDQCFRVRVLRIGENVVDLALLLYLPGVHDDDSGGQRPQDAEVVGDQDDRESALRMGALQEEEYRRLHQNVESGRRLVGDEHFRLAGHAQRHTYPLAHAAAHLVGIAGGNTLGIGKVDST